MSVIFWTGSADSSGESMPRTAAAVAALGLLAALTGGGTEGARASAAHPAAPAAATFRACLVTDTGGIDDRSYNELTWQGMKAAAKADRHVKVSYLQSAATSDY